MRKIFLLASLAALLASTALAAPPELQGSIRASAPYGQGRLTWMMMHVYDIELWTDSPHWSYIAPFALRITYQMHFTPKELADKSIAEMQRIDHIDDHTASFYHHLLLGVFHEVHPGDHITAYDDAHGNTTFYYNGITTGTITQSAFAKPFFDIWLSPETSAPDTRAALLGGTHE